MHVKFFSETHLELGMRGRLKFIESLLISNDLDIEIIHLHRDPRGVMHSIDKVRDFNQNFSDHCLNLIQDLTAYKSLYHKYPEKVIQMSYEKFCLSALKSTELLFDHAYGSSQLPAETLEYLSTHTEGKHEQFVMS